MAAMLRLPLLLALFASPLLAAAAAPNAKRGLVYVESPDPAVNSVWLQAGSPLTWYYNYMSNPSGPFASAAAGTAQLEHVPMWWGAADKKDVSFVTNITAAIKSGKKVTNVLAFNQPDVDWSEGGSNISPADAAALWVSNFVPLKAQFGVRLGIPVVKASRDPGNWTVPFLANCSLLMQGKPCDFDFVPIHAFGNLSALKDRVDAFNKATGKPVWLTEYALNDSPLEATQAFFNDSLAYLDSSPIVERYAYFGAFRADVSNVGPNATMLDPYNRLTDIGSWYLGGNATGNPPTYPGGGSGGGGSGSGSNGGSACTPQNPCGKGSAAVRGLMAGGWLGVALGIGAGLALVR